MHKELNISSKIENTVVRQHDNSDFSQVHLKVKDLFVL